MSGHSFRQALSYKVQGDFQKCVEHLEKLLNKALSNEERAGILMNMATCKLSAGDVVGARKAVSEAEYLIPTEAREQRMYVDYYRPAEAAYTQNYPVAENLLKSFLETYGDLLEMPDHIGLRVEAEQRLAFSLANDQQFMESGIILDRLVGLNPPELDMQRVAFFRGLCHAKLNNSSQAIRWFELALGGADEQLSLEASYWLGTLYLGLSNSAMSRKHFEEVINGPADSSLKEEARRFLSAISRGGGKPS